VTHRKVVVPVSTFTSEICYVLYVSWCECAPFPPCIVYLYRGRCTISSVILFTWGSNRGTWTIHFRVREEREISFAVQENPSLLLNFWCPQLMKVGESWDPHWIVSVYKILWWRYLSRWHRTGEMEKYRSKVKTRTEYTRYSPKYFARTIERLHCVRYLCGIVVKCIR
jgi:hypothetical protein